MPVIMMTMIMANTHKSRKDQYTSSKAVVCGVEYCELQSRASFGSGLLRPCAAVLR